MRHFDQNSAFLRAHVLASCLKFVFHFFLTRNCIVAVKVMGRCVAGLFCFLLIVCQHIRFLFVLLIVLLFFVDYQFDRLTTTWCFLLHDVLYSIQFKVLRSSLCQTVEDCVLLGFTVILYCHTSCSQKLNCSQKCLQNF